MPAVRRNRLVEIAWSLHRWVYRKSGGRLGDRLPGMLPVLLLTTKGRRSGLPRTHPLGYLPSSGGYVVIASNAGEARHPAWYHNLTSTPEATIQIGRRSHTVWAREAVDDEREKLWTRVIEADSSYARYQERTDRQIPLLVLETTQA